jgi:hypothetical protein
MNYRILIDPKYVSGFPAIAGQALKYVQGRLPEGQLMEIDLFRIGILSKNFLTSLYFYI